MSDELFELRNYFYLGNYSAAATEGQTISLDGEEDRIERDVIMARIRVACGDYSPVLSASSENARIEIQAVGLLATYLSDMNSKERVLETLRSWLENDMYKDNPTVITMGAIIYAHVGDFDNALRTAARGQALEHRAIKVQVLLKMDRADVAEKEVAEMRRQDEDATLSQLAAAWVHLVKGGQGVQESLYIYRDLLERHGATDPILNGMALSHLSLKKYEDAERVLQEAIAKNQMFAPTLINSIVCAKHKSKPEELVKRYISQLKAVAPGDPWLADIEAKEREFDRLAASVAQA